MRVLLAVEDGAGAVVAGLVAGVGVVGVARMGMRVATFEIAVEFLDASRFLDHPTLLICLP